MARSLCVLVDRGPYGSIQAAEAVRHALGALGKGWEVALVLTGDAVLTALPGQSPPAGDWVSLSDALGEFLEGGAGRASVLVDDRALEARDLPVTALVPGIRRASQDEIARLVSRCDRTLIF